MDHTIINKIKKEYRKSEDNVCMGLSFKEAMITKEGEEARGKQ
jgi:hypothetical protein